MEERRTAQRALEKHRYNLENEVTLRTAELQQAKEASEAGNRAKNEFLANIRHEIRTPMNGVLGVTQLPLRSNLGPKYRRYAQVAQDSANTLLHLIDDLLDFAKIESGRFTLQEEPFEMHQVLTEALSMFRNGAEQKGIQLQLEVAPGLQGCFLGDAYRLRQILINLLSNAVKLTEQGHIKLLADSTGQGQVEKVLFQIEDTGIGISPEATGKIFRVFTQEDGSVTRRYGGTGLGLSIFHALVQALGGWIEVESTKGKASTFRFELPFTRIDRPTTVSADPSLTAPPFERRYHGKVLVAEDKEVNRIVAREHLERLGFSVDTVENGKQAREARRNGDYQIIFMDCHMPDMDGFEATTAIRTDEDKAGRSKTPVVALTADAQADAHQHGINVGMDGFLIKPFQVEALIAEIERILDKQSSPESPPAPDV